jgi:integrase
MAIRTVTIKIRIKTPDGKRVYAVPVYEAKGRLRALYARVNGKAEHHPEGVYALRYGSKWEFCGQHTDVVAATKLRREQELEDSANTQAPITPITQYGPKILDSLEINLAQMGTTNLETGKEAAAKKSIDEMRRTVEAFQRTCKKTYVHEVTGADLVGYFAMMRVQANLDPKAPDYVERLRQRNTTVKNHYSRLRTFFKKHKINIAALLEPDQIPHSRNRVPEAYTPEQIAKMWAAAKPEEKIRLQFFCVSGFRKKEVAYLRWTDIDLNTGIVTVQAKEDWGPKDKESRSVVLPDYMVSALKERRAKRPNDVIVFPSATGMVADKNQLLYMLKSVARLAGVRGRVDLHKFRSTYASYLNKSGKVTTEEIAGRLGHASVSTTRAYLERMNQGTDRAKRQSNEALAIFA